MLHHCVFWFVIVEVKHMQENLEASASKMEEMEKEVRLWGEVHIIFNTTNNHPECMNEWMAWLVAENSEIRSRNRNRTIEDSIIVGMSRE
jgi:hypothetical protein